MVKFDLHSGHTFGRQYELFPNHEDNNLSVLLRSISNNLTLANTNALDLPVNANISSMQEKRILLETADLPELVEAEFVEPSEIQVHTHEHLGLGNFVVRNLVGQGAFGKVYQVHRRETSEIYAMKVIRKDKIIKNGHAQHIISERDIMMKLDHPFVVHLKYSFQTRYRLYLVLDFINGGHLFFHLTRQVLFREDMARVYAAEIVSAVSYLHANGIMHRDIKPENILLDAEGHIVLTDFGLAKQLDECTRYYLRCGTLEYMAPEILLGKGYDKSADWWSFGIVVFAMLTGKQPFIGGNKKKTEQKILKDKLKMPAYLTAEAHSLLKRLLQKEPSKRLGSGTTGIQEIKGHKWFKSINWKKLEAKEIKPSFIPVVAGTSCVANFDEEWTKMPLLESAAATEKQFQGFSFSESRN